MIPLLNVETSIRNSSVDTVCPAFVHHGKNNSVLIEFDARHPIDLINHLVLLSKQVVCRIGTSIAR